MSDNFDIWTELDQVRRQLDEARGDAARMRELLVEEVRLSYCYAAPGDNDVLGQSYCDPEEPCWICRARAALTVTSAAPAPAPTAQCVCNLGRKTCPVHDYPPVGRGQGAPSDQRDSRTDPVEAVLAVECPRHGKDPCRGSMAWDAEPWFCASRIRAAPAPNPPHPPPTFEQLVTAAGPLPTTGLAGAEAPATGLDPGTVEACAKLAEKTAREWGEVDVNGLRVSGALSVAEKIRALASSREGVK